MDTKKTTLLYFYDALCGWCYGFSPVINRLVNDYSDHFNFEIISGGLATGEKAGAIGEVAPYIKAGAYKTVEDRCGVKFGQAFCTGPLEEGTMILNSLPPAIALSIVKEKSPEQAFKFAHLLHEAIYVDGNHPENIDIYGSYAAQIGMNESEFRELMDDATYLKMAHKDFALAQRYGITGFPTLIAIKNDQAFLVSQGFEEYDSIASKLTAIKNN